MSHRTATCNHELTAGEAGFHVTEARNPQSPKRRSQCLISASPAPNLNGSCRPSSRRQQTKPQETSRNHPWAQMDKENPHIQMIAGRRSEKGNLHRF